MPHLTPPVSVVVSAKWFVLFALALLCTVPAVAADEDDLLTLPLERLLTLEVRIATGTPKRLTEAPAASSVITALELEAMGAQDIGDVLETVPGLHVSNASFVYGPRYFMRGIVSTYNPHTLVLINGVPQTSLFLGDRGERLTAIFSLPVKLLDRIEVIRGPGSALYGADAFAGVINLITKSPLDTEGGQLSIGAGNFDTQSATLLQSGALGAAQGLLSLAWWQTDGDKNAIITRDAQSNIDALAGTQASLAPGPASLHSNRFDAHADIAWNDFRLRLGWMQSDEGTAQGINEALDPTSSFEHHHGTMDLTWQVPGLSSDWQLETRVSYLYSDFRNERVLLFPPGACFPGTPPNCFPNGVQGNPNLSEEQARADIDALYTGLDRHRLHLGSGFFWGDIFKTTDQTQNYMFGPGGLVARPAPVDVSDTPAVFQPENQRTSRYVFAQDEWAFAPDWELTAGLRYDHYSDVGDTLNPRLALVWKALPTLTGKLLYGEAFRPPTLFELYATSNPIALGNPDLAPEKLKSLELGVNWRPTEKLSGDLNLYEFHIRDFIDFVNDPGQPTFTARNAGRVEGRGVETEWRYEASGRLQLQASYSHQRTRDRDSGQPLGLAPSDQVSLRAIWGVAPRWQLSPQLNWVGERKRQAGDPRPALEGYTTFDFTLRRRWAKDLDTALIVRNLFDADVREPSGGPEPGQVLPNIPEDLPQTGRSLLLEVNTRW